MTVVAALLIALAAAGLGAVAGVMAAPRLHAGRERSRSRAEGLTVAQVLDRVVSHSDSGIAVVDRFGDVVLSNPRAEQLGVVQERQMEARVWSVVERVFHGRRPVDLLLAAEDLRPGRAQLAVIGQARPLGNDDNQFVVVEARDESEQIRLESTRRDFVANVSHELKTPVGAMGLLAEAMLDSADDPEVVRHFGTRLMNESRRLGALVTELIALSRLQGAQALPALEIVDVDDVVAEAVRHCTLSAEAAGITVAADAPSGLEVRGDRPLLVTALSNLVENAIAYSPRGSRVSVSRNLRQGQAEVSVTDRGIGIAAADQERVFERFFRVDPARSRRTGGTGLGLAIVKHVAANHDGGVRVWSRPGTGSTFTLWVPVHTEAGDDPTEVSTLGPGGARVAPVPAAPIGPRR